MRAVRVVRVVRVVVVRAVLGDHVPVEDGSDRAGRCLLLEAGQWTCSRRRPRLREAARHGRQATSMALEEVASELIRFGIAHWSFEITAQGTSRLIPRIAEHISDE